MGEEKKPENNDQPQPVADNDAKKDENKSDESPPPEIVLKVYMHCEGCARKVRRCLKGFLGVEDVITDCKSSKVVVKGEKADPMKVLERVQRKSHRQVELISPIPKPPSQEPKKVEKEIPRIEDKTEEIPVITVVLTVYMHCEACAQEIKTRIHKMKGVESVVADHKSSQVTVTGAFLPENLADYVYKRTRKQAAIVKVSPEKKQEEEKEGNEQEKSGEKEEKKSGEEDAAGKENKESGEGGAPADKAPAEAVVEDPKLEMKKNELYYYYPMYHHVYEPEAQPQRSVNGYYSHQPQMFSDENPNSCTVM